MKTLLVIWLVFTSSMAYAVSLVINPAPITGAQCPLVGISYTVSKDGGGQLPDCNYNWVVTGGTISSGQGTTTITIVWNDAKSTGTLKVTTAGCSSSGENGSTVTNTYVRLSTFGLSFPTVSPCGNSVLIPLCNPGIATLCVPELVVEGTGGIGQPPRKEVDRYIFNIPAGWRANGNVTGPGQVIQTTRSIGLEPLPGTNGGTTISVVGSVANSCGGAQPSNPFNITITRTPVTISPPAGFSGVSCGYRSPVTFLATNLTCATNFAWTAPSGWTGSSTTRAITLTPPGTAGGTLSVVITLPGGGTVSTSYNIPFINSVPAPVITSSGTGTYEWCAGESPITLVATPPPGYAANFGYDWTTTNGLSINGVSWPTPASPVHTTNGTSTLSIGGSVFGLQGISVRLNNQGNCPPGAWANKQRRVGVYSNDDFNITGPQNICPNQVADFRPHYITPDMTGYQWTAPSGWSSSGASTPYFHVSVPGQFYGGAITLRIQNRCGWTNTPEVLPLFPSGGCGFSFALSPNPSSTTLIVSELDVEKGSIVTLKDKNSKTVLEVKTMQSKVELDVTDVPDGNYVLVVQQRGRTESQHIVIRH